MVTYLEEYFNPGLLDRKKREKREKGVDKEEESWYSN